MQSIRSLARAAPRTASRLSNTSTFALRNLRPSTLKPVLQSHIFSQLPRTFTASSIRLDSIATELAAKLNQEVQYEEGDSESPATSNSIVNDWVERNETWQIEDVAGEQDVFLTRKYDDETITVSFSIADFDQMDNTSGLVDEDPDETFDDEEPVESAQSGGANSKGAINAGRTSGGNIAMQSEDRVSPSDRADAYEDGEGEDQQAFPASVNVLIQRAAKGALRVSLIADAGGFVIQSVTHLPDNKTTSAATPAEILRSATIGETQYTGPPFQQLDEEVQNLLESYLDARGLNSDLAVFIPEYIDVKEQKEYVGWVPRCCRQVGPGSQPACRVQHPTVSWRHGIDPIMVDDSEAGWAIRIEVHPAATHVDTVFKGLHVRPQHGVEVEVKGLVAVFGECVIAEHAAGAGCQGRICSLVITGAVGGAEHVDFAI
nr:mitochondrial acidic protein mam33 [Quercus suber]